MTATVSSTRLGSRRGGAAFVLAGAAVALLAPNMHQSSPAVEEGQGEEPALDLAA